MQYKESSPPNRVAPHASDGRGAHAGRFKKAGVIMKNVQIQLLALLGFTLFALPCFGQPLIWQPHNRGIAEFGITSVEGGITNQSPSVFESGYDGAYSFGDSPYWGFAQSFAVSSDRTLASVELRISRGNSPGQGQFALSLVEFGAQTQTPGTLLGSVNADASNYHYNHHLESVPISSFDFSSLNIILQDSIMYAWTLTPKSSSWSGSLLIQSGVQSLYPDGFAYFLNPVPEPATPVILILGTLALAVCRAKRQPK